MPLKQPEPIAAIVLMQVVNPKAPRAGETGRVIDVLREADDQQQMIYLKLQFEDGETQTYERLELELCMP